MNTTAVNILKILSQNEMTIEDIQLYLNMERSSISKTIVQLNDFLSSINLPVISKYNNCYSLKLNPEELSFLFENFTALTSDEKIDYLFVRFISTGFLNLEKEKDILNVSRSTVLRSFQSVRDEFSKNGSVYEYSHGKGLVLKKISEKDKINFYKKLMKLFIEEDTLVPVRKELLNSIKKFDTKERLSQLYRILRYSNISINFFLLSFICSLEVCIDIFGGFEYIDESNLNLNRFKNIQNNINTFGKDFSDEFKNQLSHFLTTLYLEKGVLDEDIAKKCTKMIELIKLKFKLKTSNKTLEKILFYKIYFSFFKYDNNIFKIINVSFNENHKIILKNLNNILDELSYNLYLVDKFMIVYTIRRIIIDENFSNIKNVLLLFNEVIDIDQLMFKESLNTFIPNINFDIEATFFHKKSIIQNYENYDIIISDSNIVYSAYIIEYFSTINIHDIIENHALINGLKKINNDLV